MSAQMIIKSSQLKSDCTINIAGYRHASNLIIAACIIIPQVSVTITNLPDLVDTDVMLELLEWLNAHVSRSKNTVTINTQHLVNRELFNQPLCEEIHGSVYLMPAILARFGKVIFGKSGGCQIGAAAEKGERPVSHILSVMEAFSATVRIVQDKIESTATNLLAVTIDIATFSYKDADVSGPLTSGATKTAILLALAVKKGKTILLNPFLKSETIDLLTFVKQLGFKVCYDEQRIEIEPGEIVDCVEHHMISDPSEIITYMSLSVYHQISIHLQNITVDPTFSILAPELNLLKSIGVRFEMNDSGLTVLPSKLISACNVDITPKYVCTDHHPFLLAILLCAKGVSRITEHVWHERFQYIPEMRKLGIELLQENNSVVIRSQLPKEANGILKGNDLRAAALLVIIALKAPGNTRMTHFSHLYRGYEDFFAKLSLLGASIMFEEAVTVTEEVLSE